MKLMSQSNRSSTIVVSTALIFLLSACGGGGGSSSPVTTPNVPSTADTTPPTIASVISPLNGATGVSISPNISFRASEPLSAAKVILTCGGTVIPTNTSVTADLVVALPVQNLANGASCTATVDSLSTKDLAGNKFVSNVAITNFITLPAVVVVPPDTGTPTVDTTPPTYLGGIFPANGATEVMPNTEIQFDMSEKIKYARVNYVCTGGSSADIRDNADAYDLSTSRVKMVIGIGPLPYGATCVVTLYSSNTWDLAANMMKGSNLVLTTFKVRSRASSVVCDQTAPRTPVPIMKGKPLAEVCNGIFADPAISSADYGELALTRSFAMDAIKKFFGTSRMTTVPDIIFCKTAECSVFFMDSNYGGRIMPQGMSTQNGSFTAQRDTFVVGDQPSEFDRLLTSAHELTHLELIARIGNGRVPTWFNEGLATYVGGTPNCKTFVPGVTVPYKPSGDLKDQTKWSGAASGYCQGSDEITSWVQKNGKQALIDLLDKVKNGAEFYSVYGNLIN